MIARVIAFFINDSLVVRRKEDCIRSKEIKVFANYAHIINAVVHIVRKGEKSINSFSNRIVKLVNVSFVCSCKNSLARQRSGNNLFALLETGKCTDQLRCNYVLVSVVLNHIQFELSIFVYNIIKILVFI